MQVCPTLAGISLPSRPFARTTLCGLDSNEARFGEKSEQEKPQLAVLVL